MFGCEDDSDSLTDLRDSSSIAVKYSATAEDGNRRSSLWCPQVDDDGDDRPASKECLSILAVRESNLGRKAWSLIVAILLGYTGTIFPYRLSFVEFKIPDPIQSTGFWSILELIIDILFWLDLVFTFFFTYKDKEGVEVCDLGKIATRYLRTFFLLNLLACLPPEAFTWIISAVMAGMGEESNNEVGSVNKSLRLIRLQRISRLARLARLTRLVKMVTFVAESPVWAWVQSLRGVRVLNFFFGLVWAVHLLACGWYLCASLHNDHSRTWIARRVVDVQGEKEITLLDESSFTQWANAMYFVLTVFTTVGFGDISAVTTGEILYVCFTMIVGAVVHSIIVSEMINTITSVDQSAVYRTKQKELVVAWANQVDLNVATTRSLVRWTKTSKQMQKGYDREEMRKLLTNGAMPSGLLNDLANGVFDGRLMENAFITGCQKFQPLLPSRFPLVLALAMTQRFCSYGEFVYYCYDHAWSLFLVLKGTYANIGKPGRHGGVSELPPKLVRSSQSQISIDAQPRTRVGSGCVISEVMPSPATSHALEQRREDGYSVSGMSNEDKNTLYPYQLFGIGNYFGEAELFVSPRPRASSVRCEADRVAGGCLLVLHKNDVNSIGEEFPHLAWMWRAAARRRELHRKAMLNRLKRGRSLRHFAAWVIQTSVRKRWRDVRDSHATQSHNRLQGGKMKPILSEKANSPPSASHQASPATKHAHVGVGLGDDMPFDLKTMTESYMDTSHRKAVEEAAIPWDPYGISEKHDGDRHMREDIEILRREVSEIKSLIFDLQQVVRQALHKPMKL